MKALAILSGIGLFCAQSAMPQSCQTAQVPTRVMPNTIVVEPIGFPPELQSAVTAAAGMWNASTCNHGGFPHLQVGGQSAGLPVIYLQYVTSRPGIGECGQTQFDLTGSNIYQTVKPSSSSSLTYSCGPADIVAQSIAHELGHDLGVGDTAASCVASEGSYIMSPLHFVVHPDGSQTFTQRSVQPSECQMADMVNRTLAEGATPPKPPPPVAQQRSPTPPNDGGGGTSTCEWANFCVTAGGVTQCEWYCL